MGESLAKSFWRDGKPKQTLSFDRIEVRPLGDRHALSTGHFVLTGGGEADRSGWFSLTWEKTGTAGGSSTIIRASAVDRVAPW